jgi:hypothetical protein
MATTYYIMLSDDGQAELDFDANTLGDESFGTFYANRGMKSLMSIVNNHPEMLETLTIVQDSGKKFTITEFLDKLSKWKVLYN